MKQKKAKLTASKSTDAWPTPFELVQTAIALCRLRKDSASGDCSDPANLLPAAGRLLDEARAYLDAVKKDPKKRESERKVAMEFGVPEDYHNLNRPIPFDVLLLSSGEISRGKKLRTNVGVVTTRNGLEKAIRRYFPESESTRIISREAMTWDEYERLLASQSQAIAHRAAKRVKGKDRQKSQPVQPTSEPSF
jgi:hypothetical protein